MTGSDDSKEREGLVRAPIILVVTPNPALTSLIRASLGGPSGAAETLVGVDSMSRGLEQLACRRAELVLLDLPTSGDEATQALEAIKRLDPDVPVLVLGQSPECTRTATATEPDTGPEAGPDTGDIAPQNGFTAGLELLRTMMRAVIEQHQANRQTTHWLEGMQLALRGAGDGQWDWDIDHGTVTYSARWNAMLGLHRQDTVSDLDDWLSRVHAEDLPALDDRLTACRIGEVSHLECECRVRTDTGWYRWMLIRGEACRNAAGRVVRIAGLQTDINDRKAGELQARHQALHDPLTGVPNRTLFRDRVSVALLSLRRKIDNQFAVLYLDLDRFKLVNDMHGHAVGDALLVAVTHRLQTALRPADTLARLGGDEMAVLLGDVQEPHHATHVALRLLELVRTPFELGNLEVRISASIGIALSRTGYPNADAMLHDADIAMYRAKALGGNQYRVFDPELHDSVVALLRLESELRRAVDEQQFVMHYQPVVSLSNGQVAGFEALVRWDHPQRGLVAPAQFIGVAEETGLIHRLGWWVVERACRQIKIWQDRFPRREQLWISVNVSTRLIIDPGAVERLRLILASTGVDPSSLRLEIIEKSVADHATEALERLSQIRALGVHLSIDDFGTGYSSLSQLQQFQYDVVKIDPSFIKHLADPGHTPDLVETILSLADRLGIGVIAEGVETEQQANRLRQLRCPHGQGFWFARPQTVKAIEQLLDEGTGLDEQATTEGRAEVTEADRPARKRGHDRADHDRQDSSGEARSGSPDRPARM